jgi:fermentation-respiration switch protein FrsA (DUF1100 family)
VGVHNVFRRSVRRVLLLAALASAAGCSAHRLFYYPNAHLYADPHTAGIDYEVVRYPSLNGRELVGLYFATPKTPKGTVVHFHGNFGNVSNHFSQSTFLLERGFDVLIFDYQGYGGSKGRPTPKHTVEDGLASVRYAESRRRGPGGVAVFGQSLGAAVATVTAAREPGVRAAVLEAGFTSYRAIARDVLKRSWVTWPLSWFAPTLAVRRRYDPIDHVAMIAPRPVLLIHGDADLTIPVWMAERLFAAAGEPKSLWIIPGGEHLGSRRAAGRAAYEDRIAAFLEAALAAPTDSTGR